MSVAFFITIDTEEDQWTEFARDGGPVRNIDRIPQVQELFDRYGAVPTYLVTYPVVKDDHAAGIIRNIHERGLCEIGTHCHPWNTPPFEEEITRRSVYLCNLEYELQFQKIQTLHNVIRDRFGVTPICFRAGRWGFGPNVARCIHGLGYRIDTSITPFWDWTGEQGPDFSHAPAYSYRFDVNDIFTEAPDGCLLEVPPTIGFLQKNFERSANLRKKILSGPLLKLRLLGIMAKLKMLNLCWLTPELCNGSDMISLANMYIQRGSSYLNMTFHSVSLLPGRSEYIHSEQEFRKFLQNIEAVLRFAADRGFDFMPLSGALKIHDRSS